MTDESVKVEAMPVLHLTPENFNTFATQIPNVVIDFWAPWCGPCQRFGPIFEEVHNEYPEIQFCKCDTEECRSIALEFRISAIPTIFFIKNGQVVDAKTGALSAERLREELNRIYRQ